MLSITEYCVVSNLYVVEGSGAADKYIVRPGLPLRFQHLLEKSSSLEMRIKAGPNVQGLGLQAWDSKRPAKV